MMTPNVTNKYARHHVRAAARLLHMLPLFAAAFQPSSLRTRRVSCTNLNYFDDVSRDNSIGWTPTGNELDGIGDGNDSFSFSMDRVKKRAAEEKAQAIRRLFGHDAETASALTTKEVGDETLRWCRSSSLVGSKSTYDELLGMDIHRSESLVSCLACFWRSAATFIKENADERYPKDIWKTDNLEFSRVFLVVFPRCPELFDYDTMRTLKSAIEFSKEPCTHYGNKFHLTLFHPRYEHAPKLINPRQHSPFPTLGLHVCGEREARAEAKMQHQLDEDEDMDTENATNSNLDDFIPHLREKKQSLEALFNAPAAVSSLDSRAFGHTYQELSDSDIVAATKEWIDQSRSTGNRALKHIHTADGWVLSEAIIAEEAFADIWRQISALYDYCTDLESANKRSETDKVNYSVGDIMSTIFISKKYSTYSATDFKRFAVAVNAALKHLTGGKMFLELFHPEFVGNKKNKKSEDANRRSPFPTIQICYRFGSGRSVR